MCYRLPKEISDRHISRQGYKESPEATGSNQALAEPLTEGGSSFWLSFAASNTLNQRS